MESFPSKTEEKKEEGFVEKAALLFDLASRAAYLKFNQKNG